MLANEISLRAVLGGYVLTYPKIDNNEYIMTEEVVTSSNRAVKRIKEILAKLDGDTSEE